MLKTIAIALFGRAVDVLAWGFSRELRETCCGSGLDGFVLSLGLALSGSVVDFAMALGACALSSVLCLASMKALS